MQIQAGATDVTRYIMIADSADGTAETGVTITNLDQQYIRSGAAPAAKVDMTAHSAIDDTHADNKGYEVDSTSSPGLYRIDWPDAAFAAGVDHVILVVSGTGFAPAIEEVQLIGPDPTDTKWGCDTALVGQRLDHLVAVADSDDAVDNSIVAKLASKAATANWSDFSNTTDSLEAVSDRTSTIETSTTNLQASFSTGADSLHGHVTAMMSKAASDPSGVGTFAAAADSQEAIRELLDNMAGSGFSTGTDSLTEIRDAIDTLVAPSVVGSSALSGSGFLSDCVTLIRRMTDEPSLVPKYTDSDMVEHLTSAMTVVMSEIHNNSDHNILCRFDITLVSGQQTYILPPNVGEIWAVRKMSTTTPTRAVYEVWTDNHWSSHQSGFVIEHNEFRLLTDWRCTDTLEILYVPNGESLMHLGTASAAAAGTITLASTPTDGTLDTRANAYAGYLCRLLESTEDYIQERIIDSYVNTTRVATLTTDWDPTPTGTIVYEVLPTYSNIIKHCACMQAAMDILGNEGNDKRMKGIERRYLVKIRALRQMIGKKASRFGGHMIGDTSDNDDRGDYSGWLV